MKTRKELRDEYKQMKFQMGVFRIINKVNGKFFIGSAQDLVAKWHSQQFQLNAGMRPNPDLQKDWKELGPESFDYEIVETLKLPDDKPCDIRKELKILEQMVIDEIQPFDNKGYHKRS